MNPSNSLLIVNLAYVIRREGILALESQIATVDDPLLRKGVLLMIDGSEQEYIKEVLDLELDQMSERHMKGGQMFSKMGGFYADHGDHRNGHGTHQHIGQCRGDPNDLIHHIAGAFIATLWGVFNAKIIWLPMGDKLKFRRGDLVILSDSAADMAPKVISARPEVKKEETIEMVQPVAEEFPMEESICILPEHKSNPWLNPRPSDRAIN
jgi:flagellar motor component MotA